MTHLFVPFVMIGVKKPVPIRNAVIALNARTHQKNTCILPIIWQKSKKLNLLMLMKRESSVRKDVGIRARKVWYQNTGINSIGNDKTLKNNKSLKIQLILYFGVLLVVTLSIISFIYYQINSAQIKENTGKLYGQNARMALSLIENNTEQAYNLLDYIVLNNRIKELLQRQGMQAAKFDQKNLEAINDISNLG